MTNSELIMVALIWYVWMQVFALCGWLVASRWLRHLPDRGYGISKVLGIILGGFFYWITVTIGLAHNDNGAVILALIIVAMLGVLLRIDNLKKQSGVAHLDTCLPSRRYILVTELLFGSAFIIATLFRAYNPDIIEAGGEKFMELMFLNSILRSSHFPPNDAWLSGFSISYYYFGYVIMAMFTRISGIAPGIAFNLSGAMFFALSITSSYSIGVNLWSIHVQRTNPETESLDMELSRTPAHHTSLKALFAGILTAIMVCIMGNLGGFTESVRCAKVLPTSFWAWLDVRGLDTKPVECDGLRPTRYYWWWDWSRVVHDYSPLGADQEVITETPVFSFILGDNHPHVMSLPLVLLAITLALHYFNAGLPSLSLAPHGSNQQISDRVSIVLRWLANNAGELLLLSIVLGGLAFMNTWDLPVYGAFVIGAASIQLWRKRQSLLPILFLVAALLFGYLLYLPFYATFSSQARGIGVNLFNGTRFVQFFLMFAPFFLAMLAFAVFTVRKSRYPIRKFITQTLVIALAAFVLAIIGFVILGVLSPQVRGWINEFNASGSVVGVPRQEIVNRVLQRLADPWVVILLLLAIAACVILLLRCRRPLCENAGAGEELPSTDVFVLLLFLFGSLLTVAVEFIFLQDLFGTRMNTVFKFFYQAWILWAIASAYVILRLASTRHWLSRTAAVVVLCVVAAGLLYPLFASLSKTSDFSDVPNLDGSAYLKRSKNDDAKIIAWLNANVAGDPVIIEAPATSYGAYQYNGRIAAFTGLPTVLGWAGHEHQWRGNYAEPAKREPLIESFYNTTDLSVAQDMITRFHIQYVIVGVPERGKYQMEGLDKFSQLCTTVFQAGASSVYQCYPK